MRPQKLQAAILPNIKANINTRITLIDMPSFLGKIEW